MTNPHHYAVILAGGKGERFWPLSTSRRPKQLLSLVGEKALLAQAVDRLHGLIPPERVLVVTNQDLVAATREAAPSLPPANVVGEPVGRDTAPAVALAAALVKARDPQASFCILTADQVIGNLDVFQAALRDALAIADREDLLITIGIKPAFPATGFGYVQFGNRYTSGGTTEFLKVRRFVEKPDIEKATEYLKSGDYAWNSGMFIWSVRSIESALRQFAPELAGLIDQVVALIKAGRLDAGLPAVFEPLKKISIDYAVMEKAQNIIAARGVFAWDDVGSWPALENHFPTDAGRNILIGDCATIDASGNIVYSRGRLTALIGVTDLIVVQSDGVTMICPKEKAQDIKKMVAQLRDDGIHGGVV